MGTMNKRLTEKEHWDQSWNGDVLAYRINLRWLRTYLYNKMDKIFKTVLRPDPTLTFFEAGCGGGKWLVYFSKVFNYRIAGIDYSETGALSAQKTVSAAGIDAKIICNDIFTAQLKEKYDIVLSDGFIEHFADTEQILTLLSSSVNNNGYLVTIVPNLTGFHRYLIFKAGRGREIFDTHKAITKKEMVDIYNSLGYQGIVFHEMGSIIPKTISFPSAISKGLNVMLRAFDFMGIPFEGERVSSTYLIIGRKSNA